jgi:Ca2+-binding EF-hand superfamily protein
MKKLVPVIATVAFAAGCQTLQDLNPLATASATNEYDTDQDGVISRQEAQSVPALSNNFNRIDTNRSGGIDPNEYTAATVSIAEFQFGEADVNGDGVISEREAAAMPASLYARFDAVDADADGNVSQVEYQAANVNLLQEVEFESLDTDGDGVISVMEAEQVPFLAADFERLDADGDGLVGRDEFRAAQR